MTEAAWRQPGRGAARAERWAIRLVLGAALLLAVWGTYGDRLARAGPAAEPRAARPGAMAPPFALPRADGAAALRLADLRGRPVVLNFWTTWCPPCRTEMPAFERFARSGESPAAVVGVDVREDPGTVAAFLAEYGITYPVALDRDGAVAADYGVAGLPTTVFVDGAGVVRDRVVGPLTYGGLVQRAGRLS